MRQLVLFLLCLGTFAMTSSTSHGDAQRDKSPVELRLSADKKEYRSGERPTFSVLFANVSSLSVTVLRCLDGSGSGRRYPIYSATATVDGEPAAVEKLVGFCGNMNSLTKDDFKVLAPGETYDPIHSEGCFGHYGLEALVFSKKGHYKVTVAYDVSTTEDRKFFGDGLESGGELLKKLPRVKIVSNTVELVVR